MLDICEHLFYNMYKINLARNIISDRRWTFYDGRNKKNAYKR